MLKKIIALLLLVVMLIPVAAFSAETDKGSLTVSFADTGCKGVPVKFSIYRIADENNKLSTPFNSYPVELDFENGENWLDVASTLKGYVQKDNVTPTFTAETDTDGSFAITGMPFGLYLVIGEDFTKGNFQYEAQPFLTPLPCLGEPHAEIEVKTKKSEIPLNKPIIRKVLKVWEGDNSKRRPKSITVDLLQDGYFYDSVELSRDNNWRYTWDNLPGGHEYLVMESDVPSGYRVSVRQDGITFVVRNTLRRHDPDRGPDPRPDPPGPELIEIDDEKPPKSNIPQAGVQWWPAAAMAVAGIICIITGGIVSKMDEQP